MEPTNKIFPKYKPYEYDPDNTRIIAADENGEIVLMSGDLLQLDLNPGGYHRADECTIEYEVCLRNLVNILSKFYNGEYYYEEELNDLIKNANNLILMINSEIETVNLPLINENNIMSPNIIYDAADDIVMYYLDRCRPEFDDYFKVLFKTDYGYGPITNADYCYPISKVIDELPEDSCFLLLEDIIYCCNGYPSISNKINYNLPANIKFIEKFYGDLENVNNNATIINLDKEKFSSEEINILIGNENGKDKIEFNNSIIRFRTGFGSHDISLEQKYEKGNNSFENLINKAKFIFPTTICDCRVTKFENGDLYAFWDFEALYNAGLISEKFYDLKYSGNGLTHKNSLIKFINGMRKLKGLPVIDFKKHYFVID